MQYHEIELLISAAGEKQWPDSNLPEIMYAGRSNAGKSSLINSLCGRKNFAYKGKTPGKTRLLNFYEVDKKMIFTDAPGYGYAMGIRSDAKSFAKLLDPYFERRQQLKGMILVLDCRRTPNDDDKTMIEYARSMHLPVIAALTKTDKLSKSQLLQQTELIARELQISKVSAIPVSSLNKTGMDEMWKQINNMIKA